MKISYNAILEFAEDGINIAFPDIPNAFTCAYSRKEAIKMAKEVLEITLHKEKYSNLPRPTKKDKISIGDNSEIVEITIFMELRNDLLFGDGIIDIKK